MIDDQRFQMPTVRRRDRAGSAFPARQATPAAPSKRIDKIGFQGQNGFQVGVQMAADRGNRFRFRRVVRELRDAHHPVAQAQGIERLGDARAPWIQCSGTARRQGRFPAGGIGRAILARANWRRTPKRSRRATAVGTSYPFRLDGPARYVNRMGVREQGSGFRVQGSGAEVGGSRAAQYQSAVYELRSTDV